MGPCPFSTTLCLFYSDLFEEQEKCGSKFLVRFALRQKNPFAQKNNSVN